MSNFTDCPERSGGLIAPRFKADVVSRSLGPIPSKALNAASSLAHIYDGATLLGLPLADVVVNEGRPPTILPVSGNPPGAKLLWNLRLKDYGPLKTNPATKVVVEVESSPARSECKCSVENFSFVLPARDPLVTLKFGALHFVQLPGHSPTLRMSDLTIEFGGPLRLLDKVLEFLRPLLGANTPQISTLPSGITASYTIGIEKVATGSFLLRNVLFRFAVEVPFNPNPVTVSLGFASRDNPFNLSVLAFGGGGYIDVQIGQTGLTRLEASMEFGAVVAVNFIVASAEVHALGGIRLLRRGNVFELEAFIRIGGSVEVLGLVSVSVELLIVLEYFPPPANCLSGHAKLVIEVDLTLFSESVTIDSGEWVLSGPAAAAAPALAAAADFEHLRVYYKAFAS